MRILSFLFIILLSAPVFAFELKTELESPFQKKRQFDLSFRDGAQWSALIQSAEFDTVFSEQKKNHFPMLKIEISMVAPLISIKMVFKRYSYV